MKNILKNVKIITLNVNIWTGRRSLSESDLKLKKGSQLPPETLAKLGSKLVMNPDELSVFQNLKTAAVRAALSVGTRFLGGYMIPNDKIDGLMEKLNSIESLFNEKKEKFRTKFEEAVTAWIDANPGWEDIIRNSAVTADVAASKLNFSKQVFDINPVDGQEEGLQKEVDGLAGQLREEIEVQAQATWKQSFKGKTEVTQKALRPIKAMVAKIDGLTFIEPSLYDLARGLQDTLSGLPDKGVIKGKDLAAACGILAVLGNIPDAASQEAADDLETEESATETAVLPLSPTPAQQPLEWF